jgi:hypothetical protein
LLSQIFSTQQKLPKYGTRKLLQETLGERKPWLIKSNKSALIIVLCLSKTIQNDLHCLQALVKTRHIYFFCHPMHIAVVIPTRGEKKNIDHIISCFQKQTYRDFEVIFVVDKKNLNKNEYLKNDNISFITNINSKFVP